MQTAFDTAAAAARFRRSAGFARPAASLRLVAAWADSLEDLREVQRLRYQVFAGEGGARLFADLPMLMTLGGLPRRHRRPFLGHADA